jgi:hypothetical protein
MLFYNQFIHLQDVSSACLQRFEYEAAGNSVPLSYPHAAWHAPLLVLVNVKTFIKLLSAR